MFISAFNVENLMAIGWRMTSGECFENKWFYMKYIGKFLENTFDPWV
jgi:hypothetical protein